MRIGIDVRYLSHGLVGGVHTYIANFVPELIALAAEHPIFLYADTKAPFELSDLPKRVTLRLLPYRNFASSIYHDGFMAREMKRDQIEVAHFPANYGFAPTNARTVITLHDAINIMPWFEIMRGHAKTARTITMMTYLHFSTLTALRRADLLLTVSAHAAGDIARYSHFAPEKIVPIPHAPSSDFHRIEDSVALNDVRQRYGLTRAFVLADALKNPGTLAQAWRLLNSDLRASHEIVFFARRPDVAPEVHAAVADGHARLLINPPRQDLIALYNMADAFVFPSWIEGFGLPILEAMACGAPVIASNRYSIPEVAGDAAMLVDAEDARALANCIERILNTPAEAERLRGLGFARAAQFSWRKTAQRILDSYLQTFQVSTQAPGKVLGKNNATIF